MSRTTKRHVIERALGPNSAPSALVLTEAVREFTGRRVLGPVGLRLDAGVLAVVTGPNGAGKTTLLRIAAGLLAPSSGERVCPGRSVYLRPGAGARHSLRVAQVLAQTTALAGTSPAEVRALCAAAGLDAVTGQRVDELSSGQHARLSVALAAAAGSTLVCLDEPTAHLDAAGVEDVRTVIRLLMGRGAAVLLASHSPEQFADLADASLRLTSGRLREAGC